MSKNSESNTVAISWEEAAKLSEDYAEVLAREEFGYDLIIDQHDTLRWKANPQRENEIMNEFGATDLNDLFGRCRADKNDPKIRELYKAMGYSLYGFWEVFYWEVNNEDAWAYQGRLKDLPNKRKMGFQVEFLVDGGIDPEDFQEEFEALLDTIAEAADEIHEVISFERLLY